ncbi:HAD-like domain-containing protein [Zopfochytrium polystomum]|nr:HAD-like domain-containing protein [Zopfochytrium polystomum]
MIRRIVSSAHRIRASPPRRWRSSTTCPSDVGVAFDIDGVLIKGKAALPQAIRSLRRLDELKVPYICLTNGGGMTEEAKAAELSSLLKTRIAPDQIVLAHTPMADLAQTYAEKQVLIIGRDSCRDAAAAYGLHRTVLAEEVLSWRKDIWAFRTPKPSVKLPSNIDLDNEPISAVMMFHDSQDWGRDIQIVTDLLTSNNGLLGTKSPTKEVNIPIYYSAADFLYSSSYPKLRFGQGAFHLALNAVYKELAATQGFRTTFPVTLYGKPETITYKFADRVLLQRRAILYPGLRDKAGVAGRKIYMVGDNPASDIEGANRYGWFSVLTRTGVYSGGPHSATAAVGDVEEAVDFIMNHSGVETLLK